MIDHIKDGNKSILLSISKGAVVDEVIAPSIILHERLQINLFSKQEFNQFLLLQQLVKDLGYFFDVVVLRNVVY